MNLLHSRDIYYIMRDVLKLLDTRIINHGSRTAYILYHMLKRLDKYEMYELAEFAMLATVHDIGAYETDRDSELLQYETKEFMPHSIYGYLFMLYIMPFKDMSKILLYHHTDFNKLGDKNYAYRDVIECLNLAEKMDIYSNILGNKFDPAQFMKHSGTKYSPKALDLFYTADKQEHFFEKIASGEYRKDLAELFDEYLIFTNEEKKETIEGLMFVTAFRSEYTAYDVVTCECICDILGEKLMLSKEDAEKLHYAAALHDAGMCAIPKEIIEAPRRLSDEEMANLRTHVKVLEQMLEKYLDKEVLDIISAHHERGNGSGYPRGLKEDQMNRLQKILQVADTITGLTSPRSYREPKSKQQVVEILKSEANSGKLSSEVVRKFVNSYDEIMDAVASRTKETMSTYRKLKDNYKTIREQNKQ